MVGAVAQLGERLGRIEEVAGSIPVRSIDKASQSARLVNVLPGLSVSKAASRRALNSPAGHLFMQPGRDLW